MFEFDSVFSHVSTIELSQYMKSERYYSQELLDDNIKLIRWQRKILSRNRVLIDGIAAEHLLTIFELIEPKSTAKYFVCQYKFYEYIGKVYQVTTEFGPTKVEEIIHGIRDT